MTNLKILLKNDITNWKYWFVMVENSDYTWHDLYYMHLQYCIQKLTLNLYICTLIYIFIYLYLIQLLLGNNVQLFFSFNHKKNQICSSILIRYNMGSLFLFHVWKSIPPQPSHVAKVNIFPDREYEPIPCQNQITCNSNNYRAPAFCDHFNEGENDFKI